MPKDIPSPQDARVPRERSQFRALLLANPNYFGTLSDSPFKAVKAIQSNKSYEEIGCVGFHPQSKRLDAVIFVKEPFGYNGDVCTTGNGSSVGPGIMRIGCDWVVPQRIVVSMETP